jgi:hypothetical protein
MKSAQKVIPEFFSDVSIRMKSTELISLITAMSPPSWLESWIYAMCMLNLCLCPRECLEGMGTAFALMEEEHFPVFFYLDTMRTV